MGFPSSASLARCIAMMMEARRDQSRHCGL
jgi:hypothetical protein